jgi:hypothetical protein
MRAYLDRWVAAHHPDAAHAYGKGWWECIECMRRLRDQHGWEALEVPATDLMETPPPSETLRMPVYRMQHHGMACSVKTDFGPLPPCWFLRIRTPERLPRTYGLFDPSRDWQQEPRYLDGFREAWRSPPFSASPLCFPCAVESELDVSMLIRLLIGTPGAGSIQNDPLLRRSRSSTRESL